MFSLNVKKKVQNVYYHLQPEVSCFYSTIRSNLEQFTIIDDKKINK